MIPVGSGAVFVRRFDRADRAMHAILMVSFLGLAATGLPLLFSESAWASKFAHALGGFAAAGTIHRIFAGALIAVFLTHLARLFARIFIRRDRGILWGPTSLVVRGRMLPSGRPAEEVHTLEQPDPTWRVEYDHFRALCQTGGSNIDTDIWINDTLNGLAARLGVEMPA